jgi:ADP-heptose:LPS heptosyltransferase
LGPAPADLQLVEAIVDMRADWRVLPRVSLAALAEVFRGSGLVVAPSTGPLHLAHYVGAPTLGIYSPVRSHQPRRWAPWGGMGKSSVLSPGVKCPAKRDCLGKRCPNYYCVDKLAESELAATLEKAM